MGSTRKVSLVGLSLLAVVLAVSGGAWWGRLTAQRATVAAGRSMSPDLSGAPAE